MFFNLFEMQWGRHSFYLTIKTWLYFTSKSLDSIKDRQMWFSFLLWHTRWPWGLYITSWTYLKVLPYCLPQSCHLLLVESMSSLLTPVWAMHGLLMLKFSWHYDKHPNTSGILLQIELSNKTLFVSRVEWQFATHEKENWIFRRHYVIFCEHEHLWCHQTKIGDSLCGFIKCSWTFYFQITFTSLQSYQWQSRNCSHCWVLVLTKSYSLVEYCEYCCLFWHTLLLTHVLILKNTRTFRPRWH